MAVLFDFFSVMDLYYNGKFTFTGSNGHSRDVTCNPFYYGYSYAMLFVEYTCKF